MDWWKRWIDRRPRDGPTWSFPRRLTVTPGSLDMTAFDHEIQTFGRVMPCWTFVSDGLLAYGQKELVLTVARSAGEHPRPVAEEVAKLLRTVRVMAQRGQLVDVGGMTIFGEPGPFGCRGLVYIELEQLQGVELPMSALTVIPLIGEETEVARRFGVTRILGRLAAHSRHYPCPPWWDRGRHAVAAPPGDETSILSRIPVTRVPGVSARTDPEHGILLHAPPSAQEPLRQALAAAPHDGAFALLLERHPEADGLLVWRPADQHRMVAGPDGSQGARVSLSFVAFAIGVGDGPTGLVEDGACISCTKQVWDEFVETVHGLRPARIAASGDQLGWGLDWAVTAYRSSIDGRSFTTDGSWRTSFPKGDPTHRHGAMDGIVLLTPENEIAARVSPRDLGAYLLGIREAFTRQFADETDRTAIQIRVHLRPGQPAAVTGSGNLDEARIAELVAGVPLPSVSGPIVFECALSTHRDEP